jgi:hypothetical protein
MLSSCATDHPGRACGTRCESSVNQENKKRVSTQTADSPRIPRNDELPDYHLSEYEERGKGSDGDHGIVRRICIEVLAICRYL